MIKKPIYDVTGQENGNCEVEQGICPHNKKTADNCPCLKDGKCYFDYYLKIKLGRR